MGVILSALTWLVGHSLEAAKQVALTLKSAFIQVRGFLAAFFLVNARRTILLFLAWGVVFALLSTALSQVVALFGGFTSWIGIVEEVQELCPSLLEGVVKVGWEGLALEQAFKSVLSVFSAWLAGWSVFRGVQYLVVVRQFGLVRGYWRGLLTGMQ